MSRLVMSCHVMSCHVLSCHVMSCHLTYSHVMSCHVMSCHVMSRHVMSCHVMSRLVMSCHVMSSHVMSCHVMSCHVMSCLVTSCHVMPCHVTSLLNSSIMAAGWPRRGFRNRGPVRESGSERRTCCGAVRTASVRCAHFFDLGVVLRGRLRESCVLGACPGRAGGHVSALCRGDWVPGAWSTCVWRGRLRESCVLGACWEHARGPCRRRCAVGIGLRACRARMILRVATCVSRHGDWCWASRVGVAVPWGLLGGLSSRWRPLIRIGEQGVLWVAPCH